MNPQEYEVLRRLLAQLVQNNYYPSEPGPENEAPYDRDSEADDFADADDDLV